MVGFGSQKNNIQVDHKLEDPIAEASIANNEESIGTFSYDNIDDHIPVPKSKTNMKSKAPSFEGKAVLNLKIIDIKSDQFKGKYLALCFMSM